MKKFLTTLLALVMMLSFAACSGKQPFDGGAEVTPSPTASATQTLEPEATEEPAAQTAEPTNEPEASTDPILGVYSEDTNTYENEYIGIGCKLDSDWVVYDEEQIAELNGIVVNMITDEAIADQLEKSGYLQPFYALTEEGLVTVNITLENLGLLYGSLLDEQAYAEIASEQLPSAFEGLGMTDVTVETDTVTFAGGEHAAIFVSGSLEGIEFHEILVCMKVGRYIANITAASYLADVTEDVLALFYAL